MNADHGSLSMWLLAGCQVAIQSWRTCGHPCVLCSRLLNRKGSTKIGCCKLNTGVENHSLPACSLWLPFHLTMFLLPQCVQMPANEMATWSRIDNSNISGKKGLVMSPQILNSLELELFHKWKLSVVGLDIEPRMFLVTGTFFLT